MMGFMASPELYRLVDATVIYLAEDIIQNFDQQHSTLDEAFILNTEGAEPPI
jgi:hypothetical protein